jgi:hypothetical protein
VKLAILEKHIGKMKITIVTSLFAEWDMYVDAGQRKL